MKVWITYAWKDNNDGDFDFLVQELEKVGVTAHYDRVALKPGQRLWEQIGELIMQGEYDGWAYLVTPSSLASEACKEELEYAVNRAINADGKFPIIGIAHGVNFSDLPASLKTRLCVTLIDSEWKEQVKAALERRAPAKKPVELEKYVIKKTANGIRGSVLYEIRPRFGEINFWCLAVPRGAKILTWGDGPVNGTNAVSPVKMGAFNGSGMLNGKACTYLGSSNRLSAATAAKIEIADGEAELLGFGEASQPATIPSEWVLFS